MNLCTNIAVLLIFTGTFWRKFIDIIVQIQKNVSYSNRLVKYAVLMSWVIKVVRNCTAVKRISEII